jgi:cystathionine gamma-lyase
LHLLKAGDHVIAGDDMYGGSFRLMDKVIRHNGVDFSFVDLTNPENFTKALKPNTKMLWLETPTNPTLKLVDIKKLSAMAASKGVISVIDNTFMSPYFQRPLELGATVVVHSVTKYINGHSDMVGGVLVTSDDAIAEKIAFLSNSMGGIQSPFDSFLAMRSLKTLAVRMKAHEAGANTFHERADFFGGIDKLTPWRSPDHLPGTSDLGEPCGVIEPSMNRVHDLWN